jgi:DNA-binding PadR family transcriptional regulator
MRHRLSPTSYLILGMIGWLERATPYQLKQRVARSIGDLWAFPHSQLYAEPARLTRLGLLAEEREPDGRRRRFYSLTDAGRDELTGWLEDDDTPPREIRDVGLLKLLFADQAAPEHVARLARSQLAAHRQHLERQRDVARSADVPATPYRAATLSWGIAFSESMLDFWRGVADLAERTSGGAW